VYGRGTPGPGLGIGPPVTPPIIKNLLIANGVVFLCQIFAEGQGMPFTRIFGVAPLMVWQGGFLWQPFTYMWLHGGLGHIAMNCFVLWMFGSQLALVWGARRFLRYYLLCGVGAGFIISLLPFAAVWLGLANPINLAIPTVGASGAIYGVLLAYSLTWPDRTIMLIFPPVAFRAIWLIPLLFGLTMIMDPTGRVSHLGHLGGVVVGWLYLRRRGDTGSLLSWGHLKYRWRRFRMRQKLRAVRNEDLQARRRRDRDRTLH
jgi:membrane associated rhomboid family serine protease